MGLGQQVKDKLDRKKDEKQAQEDRDRVAYEEYLANKTEREKNPEQAARDAEDHAYNGVGAPMLLSRGMAFALGT